MMTRHTRDTYTISRSTLVRARPRAHTSLFAVRVTEIPSTPLSGRHVRFVVKEWAGKLEPALRVEVLLGISGGFRMLAGNKRVLPEGLRSPVLLKLSTGAGRHCNSATLSQ